MNPLLVELPAEIRTERIVLRPVSPDSGPVAFNLVSNEVERLSPWLPWAVNPTVDSMVSFARRAYANWHSRSDLAVSIYDKTSGEYMGGAGIHRIDWDIPKFEIGYWIAAAFEGKGFVSEATFALTSFCFAQFGANRVEIRCDPRNVRSRAVPQRLGFDLEGTMRNVLMGPQGKPIDLEIWSRVSALGLPDWPVEW